MIKAVFLVHRRPGMGTEEFKRYWRESHAPIGSKLPGLLKYIQNHSSLSLDGSSPPYDGFVELWFDDMAAFNGAMASPEAETMNADVANFVDLERMQAFFVEEVAVISGQ